MKNDSTTQLYHHVIESLHLELGLPGSPFAHDFYVHSPRTTETQLHTVWQYCWDAGITIQVHNLPSLAQRANDRFLMTHFTDQGFSAKELRLLNICRMFLRVIYVSDLCTGDGKQLDHALFNRRQPFDHHSNIIWPLAGIPDAHCWTMWRRALGTLSTVGGQQATLDQPLGPWHDIPPGWPTYIAADGCTVYLHDGDQQFLHATTHLNRHHTRSPIYHLQPGHVPLPPSVTPTTLRQRGATFTSTGTQPRLPRPHTAPSQWWGTVIKRPRSIHTLIAGIQAGTAFLVTDGSYKDGLGTAAFTLRATRDDLDGLDLVNMTPGDKSMVDPYRAELGGLYGSVQLVTLLQHKYNFRTGGVTLVCDCLSALRRITQNHHPNPRTPHFDLIMAIRNALSSSTVRWTFQHVSGHQDQKTHYQNLDRLAQLNVDMDKMAKMYWLVLDASRPPPFSLPAITSTYSLWCGTHRIHTWDRHMAQSLFYNPSIASYWQTRSTTPLDDIAWHASGKALRQMTLYQQLWVPKWLTSFLPTGNRMVIINPQNPDTCPRCNQSENNRSHVIRCPQPEAVLLWEAKLTALESWLQRQQTKPSLRRALLSMLDTWYHDSPWRPPINTDADDLATFAAQQRAGTSRLIDGFIVTQWAESQQRYYQWMKSRKTGLRWLSSLIKRLWEIAWDMWRHRQKTLQTPDTDFLRQIHMQLDDSITHSYERYHQNPPPSIARWFSQPLPAILAETIDFKRQWVAMLQSITQHHQRNQAP